MLKSDWWRRTVRNTDKLSSSAVGDLLSAGGFAMLSYRVENADLMRVILVLTMLSCLRFACKLAQLLRTPQGIRDDALAAAFLFARGVIAFFAAILLGGIAVDHPFTGYMVAVGWLVGAALIALGSFSILPKIMLGKQKLDS